MNLIQELKNINIYHLLNDFISYSLYAFILLGLWLLFGKHIIKIIENRDSKKRFRVDRIKEKKKNDLVKHIESIIYIVFNKSDSFYVYIFFIVTIAFFLLTFLVTYKQIVISSSIIYSIIAAFIPYIYLQIKLRNIRVTSSFEAEGLITELINQYKINYFNMIEAIDKSIKFLNDYPYTKKALIRLSFGIKQSKNEDEIQEILKAFVYSIDTEWAIMLSNNIYLSITDGYNVVEALEDMIQELKDSKKALEDSKRNNNEGFTIVKVLVPIMYIGTIYIALEYFGFTIIKFFNYQFRNPMGLKFFLVMATLYIICITSIAFHKRQKFDI